LVFLPGAAEIGRVAAALQGLPHIDLLPLHGGLSLADQDRALRPDGSGRRRVVLATDIAETSLTIEGIGCVIDCGLTRKPRYEPGSGLTRLVTEPIARASAEQRAGRAGRLGPGVCYRLWTPSQQQARATYRPTEILQADLAPLALELALWGVADPAGLAWLDPPPEAAWSRAVDLLRALGAIDAHGTITSTGRRMAALPLHPRLAHMLTEAPPAAAAQAADLAALLSERDPWIATPGLPRPADLTPRLQALDTFRARRPSDGCDPRRLGAVDRLSQQFRRLLAERRPAAATDATGTSPGALLALAYPERTAQNRGGTGERFLLASGAGAVLPRDDALAPEPYLVIADLDAASGDNRIRAALPISEAELRRIQAERIQTSNTLTWDEAREAVSARDQECLGAIVLESRPAPITDADAALELLLAAIARDLSKALTWTDRARQLQARVLLARRIQPDADWPDLSDNWLLTHLDAWLAPWLAGKSRLADVRALDLTAMLAQTLGWRRAACLDDLAPEHLMTPAGTRRRIDYCAGDDPVLALPMQELFGAANTPAIFDGHLPLLVHLLSPARRPLQITRDLAGFWRGAYAEVRKEMRGRYPKHHWPEDPVNAAPVAGGVRRRAL